MKVSKTFGVTEREMADVYVLNGITFVPHYKDPGYVWPGFKKGDLPLIDEELIKMGAKKDRALLYIRHFNKVK